MSNEELIRVLNIASVSQDNIALKMLLNMAAERISKLSETERGNDD